MTAASAAGGRAGDASRSPWGRPWVAPLLGLATLLLYAQVAGHRFLHYDDNVYVTENPLVLRGLSWEGVVWAFTSPEAWYGFPLDWLSHMLDVQLFGASPGAHHLVNAVLHAVNAALVYLALVRLTRQPGRSLAVAAIFAAHPLRVEVVAWVAERKELLAALFGLLALWAHARYAERPGLRRYLLVAALFAASLLAKPMWVTLPFLLLLLDLWPLRRPLERRLVLEKLPLLALSGAATLIATLAQRHGGALRGAELGLGVRLGYALVSCAQYLGKTLWPVGLSAYYPHPGASLPGWQVALAALLLAALTAGALVQARRRPWLPVGWLWFLGTLVPVIGIVKAGGHGIADRYTYLPTLGLLVAAVWTLAELGERRRAGRALPLAGAGAVVLALGATSLRQQAYWSDQVTLFSRAVELDARNGMAHHVLSQGLAADGRLLEAARHARDAARLEPGNARIRKHLGYVLYRLGLVDEAIDELRAAIAIEPDYAEAHGNLGFAYGKKGWTEEAMKELSLERELRRRPPRR